jgi:hypothetical protein
MALYVHLAWDGGIFVIRGDTGEQLWLGRGTEDPPDEVADTFDRIVDYELPIKLVAEPHPQAIVDRDHRRTITLE